MKKSKPASGKQPNVPPQVSQKPQAEKFADLAREVEANEDEQKFDDTLRRMRYRDTTGKERKDEPEK